YSLRCILAYVYRCLNNYEQAHLFLNEAIDLNPKRPVAYFICGEIFFRQNNYFAAVDNLNKSINYKVKINNSYILLGNSYLLRNFLGDYAIAIGNYNIALKNDPNNYLCLKNCAYAYEKEGDYLSTLNLLDKLLNINKEDSLILFKLIIINILNSLEKRVYFVSNLTNLNSELCQFQESDISSLSGLVLSSKNENLHLVLPKLNFGYDSKNENLHLVLPKLDSINENLHFVLPKLNRIYNNYLICKMNVKKILSKDCFIKFIPNGNYRDYMLKHEDVSKLEGLGWIEYQTSIRDLHYD
ncbi:TPR-like protein, partial [Rhizophagus irregularis]